MKILYKQPASPRAEWEVSLFSLGIRQLFLKELSLTRDSEQITKKQHHHQNYEIHILTQGQQCYAAGDREFVLLPGQLFLIPPVVSHRVLFSDPQTQKYSLCFSLQADSALEAQLPTNAVCLQATCPVQISHLLTEILKELEQKLPFSQWTVCSLLVVLVLSILRLTDLKSDEPFPDSVDENHHLALAKQFISDNIEMVPSVPEVAAYCHLSCRQLTRIFLQTAQCTPAAYIRNVRFRKAEALLLQTDLSLYQISEQLHFSNEYYFNTFFHRHAGMSPGDFRKMHQAIP